MAIENTLAIRIDAISAPFVKGLNSATASLKNFLDRNRSVGDVVNNLKVGIGSIHPAAALAAGAIAGIGAAVTSAAKTAEGLNTLAQRTGVSTEALSQLKFAAEQSGTSIEALQPIFRTLSRNVTAASQGSKAAEKALRRIGITAKDFGKPLDQLFSIAADGIKNTENATQRLANATRALGPAAVASLPFLAQGSEAIDALRARADRLGLTISSEFAQQADDFNDNLDAIKAAFSGVAVRLGTALLPTLAKFVSDITAFVEQHGPAVVTGVQLVGFAFRALGLTLEAVALAFERGNLEVQRFFAVISGERGAVAELNGLIAVNAQRQDELNKASALTFDQYRRAPAAMDATGQAMAGLAEDAATLKLPIAELGEEYAELVKAMDSGRGTLLSTASALVEMGTAAAGTKLDALIADVTRLARTSREAQLILEQLQEIRGIEGPVLPTDIAEQRRRLQEELAGIEGPVIDPQLLAAREEEAAVAEFVGPPEPPEGLVRTREMLGELTDAGMQAGEVLSSSFQQVGGVLVDAFLSGKAAFGDFLKSLLVGLAKAIAQALILNAIISATGGPLGFFGKLFGKLYDNPTLDAFAGSEGRRWGMLFGRGARAAMLGTSFAGIAAQPAVAPAPQNGTRPTIVVHEPGPLTKVEFTDRAVIPRLRQRLRTLGEEPFTR